MLDVGVVPNNDPRPGRSVSVMRASEASEFHAYVETRVTEVSRRCHPVTFQ